MKTTSFEISKKLAEIGFKAESRVSWDEESKILFSTEYLKIIEREGFPSYDLETMLDALPQDYTLKSTHMQIFRNRSFNLVKKEASLADMAAIMFMNFNEKPNNEIKF